MKNIIKNDTRQNDQSYPKKNELKVVKKTTRMMNTRIIKKVELPETEKKTTKYFDSTSKFKKPDLKKNSSKGI